MIDEPLAEVSRYGLGPSPDRPIHPRAEAQPALIEKITVHRLAGVAVRAFADGVLLLDPTNSRALIARHDDAMVQTLQIERTLVAVVDALDAGGVTSRVLKGSALAHTAAIAPSDREFRDVDLLVPANDLGRAVGIVERSGGKRNRPELRPGFDERFAKSVTMTLDGVEIDLHRVLAPGPFGVWMRPGDLFVLGDSFSLGGRVVHTLDSTDHLLHACYHVALGQPEPAYTNLRDIIILATRTSWDPDRFDETVRRWRGEAAVARAVQLVEALTGVVLPGRLTRYQPDRSHLPLLEPYLVPVDRRFVALARATVRELPVVERARYAAAIGFPAGTNPIDRARRLVGDSRWR